MVSWLEVFLMILFVVSLADAATHRSKSSPNFAGRRRAESEFHEWRGSDGSRCDFRSCKADLPRRVGSQIKGERKKLGVT